MLQEATNEEIFPNHFQELEYKVLAFSGLRVPDQIYSTNVTISQDSWMHEVTCGSSEKHILLLHGYGGTSMTFIRLFKRLSEKYTVHALDFLGMGLSHRREFRSDWDRQQAIQYFVDAIEDWRRAKKIEKMTVAGHSFGGYLSTCYAYKYSNRVERLCLISPAGTKYLNEQTTLTEYQTLYENGSCFRKIFLSLARKMVSWEITPSRALNCCCLGSYFVDRILSGRLKLQNEEKEIWKEYMLTMSRITPNSELSFWRIFYMPSAGTTNPISRMLLTRMSFPIQFYYGDEDWMQKDTARTMTDSPSRLNDISYTVIPNSGHQIIFDNPDVMLNHILME